jgi:hypothetical protein
VGLWGGNGGEPFIGEMRSYVGQNRSDPKKWFGFSPRPALSLILVHFSFPADDGIPFFFLALTLENSHMPSAVCILLRSSLSCYPFFHSA